MKVSVIIPVFNAEQYLRKCLDSVLAQTYDNWEAIAIDDGSSDASYVILMEYANKDSRFIVDTKNNEGPGITRNCAMDRASGDMLVFLDADDYIENEYFQLLSDVVAGHGADVIFVDVIQEKADGKVIRMEAMSNFKTKSKADLLGCQMTGYMPWGGCRKAALKNLVEKHNLRYTADTVGEEAIFSFELLRNAERIAFIEKPQYHYINHPGSQSKRSDGTWEITLKKMKDHLKEKGIEEEYRSQIASFGFIVMISWLLRTAKENSLINEMRLFNRKRAEYIAEYGWLLNPEYLRKEVRFIVPFVKCHLLLPVVVAAKLIKR